MNSETVDLIATDPPFNKGRDFHATPDSLAHGASFQDRWSWENDVHDDWVEQLLDDWPNVYHVIEGSRKSYGDDMGAFLCFMGVRLLEMNRVLKNTGSMYLHCDPTASHYLKELMDAVFGKKNFRSEIIWRRTNAHNKTSRQFGPIHDVILFYSKTDKFTFHPGTRPYARKYVNKMFRNRDNRGNYRLNMLTGSGTRTGESGATWHGFDPTTRDRHWAIPLSLREFLPNNGEGLSTIEKLDLLHEQGLIVFPQNGTQPTYKQYLGSGVKYQDIWAYQPYTDGILYDSDECIDEDVKYLESGDEVVGFPTQKPVGLYARIIETSSNPNDIVLDPFCGCATTLIAAEKLERNWVGMDIWDRAHETVINRLRNECALNEPGEERTDVLTPAGEITYLEESPTRTDDGISAVPYLRVREVIEPPGERMTRQEMFDHLITQSGCRCQGCEREFDDQRYLELDHNTPRSDGGLNHISNRILLCSPCNRLKSNTRTLTGLRRENRRQGYMA